MFGNLWATTKMDTSKIVEALKDLRDKRDLLDQAISSLEAAFLVIAGKGPDESVSREEPVSVGPAQRRRVRSGKTYIDHALEILDSVDQMHIEEVVKRIHDIVGRPVSRGTVDGGISREIRESGVASRFERVAPGVYRARKGAEPLSSVA